ncbi:hypothetical protein OG689_37195 [Kitasatospora sp. NBC_00240]|uniref:hypothetical protein n=1 Tax=Kitasatospora sp. NBC_00240 TaxID=2903567 RepID=UPI00224FE25E|nr:hypothetical protein [Kitasatospora sp. NBC_00240]MCX5214832.1 hypothetical protein [Kitasatospora sp. NBC_00240]
MSLQSLGLTYEQERVYRYLLRTRTTDPDTAEAELGLPGLRLVLEELRALGVVDAGLVPLPPAAAVDLLVRLRVERTSRELARLDSAFDVVRELAEEARQGRPVELVERIQDKAQVNHRIHTMLGRFETMNAKVLARTEASDESARRRQRQLAEGLVSRTLVSTAALDQSDQLAYARHWHALGDVHRVMSEPFGRMLIVDRRLAFVRLDPGRPESDTLQIAQPGIVAALVDLFEQLWVRATDLDRLDLSATEAAVLRTLSEHGKDESAARELNISLRKYRAHVAALMTRLGAATRFQAALRAKERGWL